MTTAFAAARDRADDPQFAFGRSGFRLELHKHGGYSLHASEGQRGGWHGGLSCLVGYPMHPQDLERTVAGYLKNGAVVCSAWYPPKDILTDEQRYFYYTYG